jgi:hypothetical protein
VCGGGCKENARRILSQKVSSISQKNKIGEKVHVKLRVWSENFFLSLAIFIPLLDTQNTNPPCKTSGIPVCPYIFTHALDRTMFSAEYTVFQNPGLQTDFCVCFKLSSFQDFILSSFQAFKLSSFQAFKLSYFNAFIL